MVVMRPQLAVLWRAPFGAARPFLALLLAVAVQAAPPPPPSLPASWERTVGHWVVDTGTYLLTGLSTAFLICSIGAACELPVPAFCCYRVPYSDEAECGSRSCGWLRIRVANLILILLWCSLLVVQIIAGNLRVAFLYAFMGFVVLHVLVIVLVHLQLRMAATQARLAASSAPPQPAPGTLHSGLVPSQARMPQRRPPGNIPMRSGSLVLVIQPDFPGYGRWAGDGDKAGNERGDLTQDDVKELGDRMLASVLAGEEKCGVSYAIKFDSDEEEPRQSREGRRRRARRHRAAATSWATGMLPATAAAAAGAQQPQPAWPGEESEPEPGRRGAHSPPAATAAAAVALDVAPSLRGERDVLEDRGRRTLASGSAPSNLWGSRAPGVAPSGPLPRPGGAGGSTQEELV